METMAPGVQAPARKPESGLIVVAGRSRSRRFCSAAFLLRPGQQVRPGRTFVIGLFNAHDSAADQVEPLGNFVHPLINGLAKFLGCLFHAG